MNCNHCGTTLAEGAVTCSVCGAAVQNPGAAEVVVKERVALGILGALIGAIIGGASIVILSHLGYVAAIGTKNLVVDTHGDRVAVGIIHLDGKTNDTDWHWDSFLLEITSYDSFPWS